MASAAAEVDPGAGALEIGSQIRALAKIFHPFSADYRSTKLEKYRPSLRRGEGEWRPLLLKSTPGARCC